jgi:SpoVK/Ycf46/Vps4 family AAA+-type ATPase
MSLLKNNLILILLLFNFLLFAETPKPNTNKQNQTNKSDQPKPSQTKSDQTNKPDQTKSNQSKPDQTNKPEPNKTQDPFESTLDDTFKSALGYSGNLADSDLLKTIYQKAPQSIKDRISLFKKINSFNADKLKKAMNNISNRLLLVGPPGVGKTSLAIAIANELDWTFILIRAPMLGNEYRNSEGANLSRIMNWALKESKPVVVILDEINIFAEPKQSPYGKDITAGSFLWLLLDKCAKNSNIFIIGTTNDASKLPEQLKDRFEGSVIEIPMGSLEDRLEILNYYLNKKGGHNCSEKYLLELAKKLENFSYRKIEALVNSAYQYNLLYHEAETIITEDVLDNAYKNIIEANKVFQATPMPFSIKQWIRENSVIVSTLSNSVNLILLLASITYVSLTGKKI